ncbi:MAG: hypothetical protein RLZZ399_2401 [Verrucomicrobiota bacterium]
MSLIARRNFFALFTRVLASGAVLRWGAGGGSWAMAKEGGWVGLWDGKSLAGWRKTDFAGGGEVRVSVEGVRVDAGEELSGFHFAGKPPTLGYELEVEAQRRSGLDFFCAVTFPVGDRFLTLVGGGWGGSTVGLSSIDRADASQNETTSVRTFQDNVWYRVRLRVEAERIQSWINEERVVNLDPRGKDLDLRPGEIDLSRPLGFATFRTEALFRNIRVRRL